MLLTELTLSTLLVALTSTASTSLPAEAPAAVISDVESPKRPVPDYDGRGDAPGSIGEGLLYVPRVILFPVYLVSEYLVRAPLRWLVINAEQGQWPKLFLDFFTFGEERTAGLFPTALVDFGFRPSVGVYTFWDKLGVDANSARLYAAYGGRSWYAVRVNDRVAVFEKSRLSLTVGASRRPDYRFEGTGPVPPDDLLARYRVDRLDALLSFDSPIGDAGHFSAFGGGRRVIFQHGACCENPSLEELVDAGTLAPPSGFNTNYTVWEHGASVEWDSRRPRPAPGHGARVELNASQAFDLNGSLNSPWVSYGGALGGFIDLTGKSRVLSLFVAAKLIEPIGGDGIVPFTEFLTMGGTQTLPGFRPGTLLGLSRVAAQLEYRWPIWAFFDGTTHFGVGNVFGERFDDFRWDLLRMSFGLGIRTVGRPDHSFNMLVAAGSDTFSRGASINTFRFVLGATRGF